MNLFRTRCPLFRAAPAASLLSLAIVLAPAVLRAASHPATNTATSPATTGLPPAFAVHVTGSGRPVILIPGLSSSGAVWDGTVEHLKDRYQCHVLTLAGFAGQKPIAAPFLETVRDQLAVYIKEQNLDHPAIIGHSLGGFLALWLASRDAGSTGPLVIVDSLPFLPAAFDPAATAGSMKAAAEQARDGMAAGGPAFLSRSEAAVKTMITRPEDVALAMTWVKTTDPRSAGNAVYDMFTHDLRPEVAKITAPALVLGTWIAYADKPGDPVMRAEVLKNFETQFAGLKGARIVLTDHARHFIMLDDPAWFYAQLDPFLAGAQH